MNISLEAAQEMLERAHAHSVTGGPAPATEC